VIGGHRHLIEGDLVSVLAGRKVPPVRRDDAQLTLVIDARALIPLLREALAPDEERSDANDCNRQSEKLDTCLVFGRGHYTPEE